MKLFADRSALTIVILIFIFSLCILTPRAAAQGPSPETPNTEPSPSTPGQAQNPEVAEIQRKLDVLAAEVEKLRSGEPEVEITPDRAKGLGLSPSAASVYRKQKGVSLAGYGEVLYENYAEQNQAGTSVNRGTQLDFLRAVFYAGYKFSDKFLFN